MLTFAWGVAENFIVLLAAAMKAAILFCIQGDQHFPMLINSADRIDQAAEKCHHLQLDAITDLRLFVGVDCMVFTVSTEMFRPVSIAALDLPLATPHPIHHVQLPLGELFDQGREI